MAPPCPPCPIQLDVARLRQDAARLAQGQATLRADMGDTRERTAHLETISEAYAVHMDRLGDAVRDVSALVTRQELALARLEGAIEVLTERPGVVVQSPERRQSTPASSLEVGAGKWSLRVRGLLPVALLIVVAAAVGAWWLAR